MESMDVAKDPAVKMKGEDLAHAYDAVRVANKSVCLLIRSLWCLNFVLSFMLWFLFSGWFFALVCVCQVSGEPAAWPAQSAGGGAEGAAAAAQSSNLSFFLWCTASGTDLLWRSSVTLEGCCWNIIFMLRLNSLCFSKIPPTVFPILFYCFL